MDILICSEKYVQILSDIVVQVAGSPTWATYKRNQNINQSEYIQKLSEVF